ncbi:MAG: hypothetical protein IKA26_03225 [Alistipes sp.]|nr:hypothetical protein [Alistipes sp.]
MKKFFALALLAAVAFVGCNPSDDSNKGGGNNPIEPCTEHDVDYVLNEVSGIYYSNLFSESEDVFNYGLVLSNQPNVYDIFSGAVTLLPNSQYLFLDLYTKTASTNHSISFKMPNGVYNLDLESSTAENTAGYEFTNLFVTSSEDGVETFFKSGTVTVTDDLIEAMLIGEDDKVYHIQAPNKLIDNTNNWGNGSLAGEFSTLNGNLQVPFNNVDDLEIYGDCYGDYMCVGKNLWLVYIDDYATGDEFMLFIHADASKSAPIGTFPILADISKEATLTGYIDSDGSSQGSFYFKLDENFDVAGYAPLKSGSVTISVNEDGVATAKVEAKDDKGNTLSGTCVTDYVTFYGAEEVSPFSVTNKMKRANKKVLAPRAKVKPVMALKK